MEGGTIMARYCDCGDRLYAEDGDACPACDAAEMRNEASSGLAVVAFVVMAATMALAGFIVWGLPELIDAFSA